MTTQNIPEACASDRPSSLKGQGYSKAMTRKVILASFVGTAIEWYDFYLYGTAAALVFNVLFFELLR